MLDYTELILLEGEDHERFMKIFRACAKYLSKFEDFKENAVALATQFEHAEFYVKDPLEKLIPNFVYFKVDKSSPAVKPLRMSTKDIEDIPFGASIAATEKHPYADSTNGALRPIGDSVGGINFWFDESDDYKWVDVADLYNFGVEDLDWPDPETILYWLREK